jgi:hypothetical protein
MNEKNILLLLLILLFSGCQITQEKSLNELMVVNSVDDVKYNYSLDSINISGVNVIYNTSFESISDFNTFYITPQNDLGSSSHTLSNELYMSGNYSHKAWFNGNNDVIKNINTNHRGYPTIQLYKSRGDEVYDKVLIEFWVWLDIELSNVENKEWFSFATLTSYSDDLWSRTILINLDSDSIVHLMHVPVQSKNTQDIYQTKDIYFPMKEWVKLKIYVDYTDDNEYDNSFAKVFLNEELVSVATFNPRIDPLLINRELWPSCLNEWDEISIDSAEDLCGLKYSYGLAQAHFGMYAPPLLEEGVVYNDDLIIYQVD